MGFPFFPDLGELADASRFAEPLEIQGQDPQRLYQQLKTMMVIRAAEERIAESVAQGQTKCPCHLGIGQEAIAVGVSSKLTKTDRVFGTHRAHSQYLAQGGSLYGLFAEVLGKATGCSKGMGGSMHLYDGANGFVGSVPIVAATISLAVGAGLAAQKDRTRDVAVAFFGDGATEEGNFHESLNFAALYKIPVLFVCENNLFSSHLHISLRQPSNSVARFAAASNVSYEVVDGNDVLAVAGATERLLDSSRKGVGPGFLEAVTYRWRGHVGHREDIDVGVKRDSDLVAWKRRDPVRRLAEGLKVAGHLKDSEILSLQEEINRLVSTEWKRAEEAPYPNPDALIDLVYSAPAKRRVLRPRSFEEPSGLSLEEDR